MVRSFTDSGWSAATQVKVVQPRNLLVAMGQGLLCLEASIVTGVIRRVCHGVPGSRTAAGHPTDHVGTREIRIACMPERAEKARPGHGDTEVGPTHSRGVAGVTPGGGSPWAIPLEGVGCRTNRVKAMEAVH
jgi:hypothetical protein